MRSLCCSILFFILVSSACAQQFEFIAMEYVGGISNRTFVIFVSDSLICGGKLRGPMAAGGSSRFSEAQMNDPYFYGDHEALEAYRAMKIPSNEFLQAQNANFVIRRDDISSITYTPKRKWGMGDIVHTGRLFVNLKNGKKREFILLGKPDVEKIKEKVNATEAGED